jgi:ABC-type lipoprotein release transport system permease subunit
LGLSAIAEKQVAEFITHYKLTAALGTLAAVMFMGLVSALLPVRRVAGIEPASIFRA